MMKYLFYILFFVPYVLFAQEMKLKKSTYFSVEGGGPGVISSVYLGQTLFSNKRLKTILQAGAAYNFVDKNIAKPWHIPVQLTNCFGNRNSFFEAGLGSALLFNTDENWDKNIRIYFSPIIGYRHESAKWFARVYLSPLFWVNGEHIYDDVTKDALNFGLGLGLKLPNK